jgi:hypothetical protein
MKNYKKLIIPKDSIWDRKTLSVRILKNLHWRIRSFLTGCNNLIKWLPTIWRQRDWDDTFIFDILQKKIEFQRKELVSSNRHTRIGVDNRDMTIVLNLIERIKTQHYSIEYLDYRETKFRFEDIEGRPHHKSLELDVIWEDDDTYLCKYPSTIRKVIKDKPGLNKSDLCFWVAQYNEEKAYDLLFKILKERMRGWWD